METTITLPFAPALVWGALGSLGLALTCVLVYLFLPGSRDVTTKRVPFVKLRARLGIEDVPNWVMLFATTLWVALVLVLVVGLFGLIIEVIVPNPAISGGNVAYLRIAGLTTVLGALVALPLTMARLGQTRRANETAEAALFNDKINAATEGLYAQRQVSKHDDEKKPITLWEDDIVQRNAAIDRLEGLAEENRGEAPRIARLLSVYVRELSKDFPAETRPTSNAVRWAKELTPARSDMEKAAQAIGRLNPVDRAKLGNEIDLRGANLQGFDLQAVDFNRAKLRGARLEGADLRNAQLQQADLTEADLTGAKLLYANLDRAVLRRADLSSADLGGATLTNIHAHHSTFRQALMHEANLTGADLTLAVFDDAFLVKTTLADLKVNATSMQRAMLFSTVFGPDIRLKQFDLTGAALRDVALDRFNAEGLDFNPVFGDASVTIPGIRPGHIRWPDHWGEIILDDRQFMAAWGD